tara:strand:- start:492 stop:1487 length:996 start_codon:yes stop_codon:yes gene_type:complete
MKWTELRTRTTLPFGGSHNSSADLFLEDAEKDLALYAKCLKRTFITLIDEKDNGFYLPNDFIEMSGSPDYDGTRLDRHTDSQYYTNKSSSDVFYKGTPQAYRIEGNKMVLFPRPTDSKLLRFEYVAMPSRLSSSTTYQKLNYKNITGQAFRVGDVVEGRLVGATGTKTTVAKVSAIENNGDSTGTLTLSDITNIGSYTGFRNGDLLVTIESEEDAYTASSPYGLGYTFDQLIDEWDTIGFGGKATIVGSNFNETGTISGVTYGDKSGSTPVIPEPFQFLMIEYAQAKLYDMLGQSQDADRHYNRYYNNRTKLAGIVANEDFGGPVTVTNAL